MMYNSHQYQFKYYYFFNKVLLKVIVTAVDFNDQ